MKSQLRSSSSDSDKTGDLSKETIGKQYHRVKKQVLKSHVSMYGDTQMEKLTLSDFLGSKAATPVKLRRHTCFVLLPQQDVSFLNSISCRRCLITINPFLFIFVFVSSLLTTNVYEQLVHVLCCEERHSNEVVDVLCLMS